MDNKLLESYLETIFELVIDEGKIVTYKSLSRYLGIHVNTAKELLYTFLLKQKDEVTCPVSATYLLAGKLDDGSLNVTVINESDLRSTGEKFAEVTSRHVYSVQKGTELKDVKVLAGIGKGAQNFESSDVVIKCSKSTKKLGDESGGARTPESNKQTFESVQNNQIKNDRVQKMEKIENGGLSEKIESPLGSKKQITTKSPVKKSSPDDKSKTKSPIKLQANSEKKSGSSKTKKPTQNIANFFANASQKNSEKKIGVVEKINGISNNEEMTSSTFESPENVEMDVSPENKTQVMTNLKRNKSKESLNKKKKGSKRKRIQVFSDSDESDSSNGEHPPFQREDDNDGEKKEENAKSPSAVLEEEKQDIKETSRNKHKKRKIIDKTVMNEDGYLETRKEVVFETDSENESGLETAEKDDSLNHQHKKVKGDEGEEKCKSIPATNAVKKQSSLLSFFKKN